MTLVQQYNYAERRQRHTCSRIRGKLAVLITGLCCIVAFAMTGCDDIDKPYEENPQTQPNDSLNQGDSISTPGDFCNGEAATQRKVLLEEYTGIKCGSCPPAASEAERLRKEHPGRVVFAGTHAGFFAQPDDQGKYALDLRTEVGKELLQTLGVQSFPRGLVNRQPFPTSTGRDSLLSYTQWAAAVDSFLKVPPKTLICATPQYDKANRQLDVTVKVRAEDTLSGNEYLVVHLTQDSLVGIQKDYNNEPEDRTDYVHHFVLRGSMNGTWGTLLSENPVGEGTTFSQQFSRSIPQEWNAEQLHVVAYVYDNRTRNVLQVEQVPAYQNFN
jgi:thiol-disulfide isomerase/thioredoxin